MINKRIVTACLSFSLLIVYSRMFGAVNEVYLIPEHGVTLDVNVIENTLAIGDKTGQKVGAGWDKKQSKLTIKCDRNPSGDVADWYRKRVLTGSVCGGNNSSASNWPLELNFAFQIRLIINGVTYNDIYIGQGNSTLRNNWYIGCGKEFGLIDKTTLLSFDNKKILIKSTDKVNEFDFSIAPDTLQLTNIDWMSRLNNDKVELSSVSLPGTHDAGTAYASIETMTKTQTNNIMNQLMSGVRVLDIRLKESYNFQNDTLGIYHGPIGCNLRFNAVVNYCIGFLKAFPDEVIVMLINGAEGNSDHQTHLINSSIKTTEADMWWLEHRMPALEEARGKIVLLNRFDQSTDDKWLGIKVDWGNDKTFVQEIKYADNNFLVEDMYGFSHARETKKKLIDTAFCMLADKQYSSYAGLVFSSAAVDVQSMADYMNSWLIKDELPLVSKSSDMRTGWLFVDFADESLIDAIIKTNMKK